MKKTKCRHLQINLIRIYLLLVVFLGLGSIVTAGTTLNFIGIEIGSINQKFSDIQFRAHGNNFMGSIFWLNAKNIETGEVITVDGNGNKTCFKQVKGIYYNAQRGNRLRPLDQDTLRYFNAISNGKYENLTISGGLFTSCAGDEYSIYGQVTYNVSGNSNPSHLIAGVQYNRDSNTMSGSFARSLQRFDNKFPIGYIYDDVGGGIGFVGTIDGTSVGNETDHETLLEKLSQGSGINNLFKYAGTNNSIIQYSGIKIDTTKGNAINTLMNAGVQGTIGLSFSVNTLEKNTILGNFDRKTLIFNALNINFSKLINIVRKNAEDLCKNKYENDGSTVIFDSSDLFCFDFEGELNNYLQIDNTNWPNLKNKIIVIKNGDLRIESSMPMDGGPVSIFIDKGNLLIKNDTGDAIGFDKNGYPAAAGVTKGINLKGNFIINGLIIGADNTWNKSEFNHKLFVNGKLASLNTPNYPSQSRIEQVTNVLGTGINNNWIRLGKVFTRECNPISGSGSDNWTACNNSGDVNALLPLVIIDGNYTSRIMEN